MKTVFAAVLVVTSCAQSLGALSFWRHPESADKHAVFVNVAAPALSFTDFFVIKTPEASVDYLTPFVLPVSLGLFFAAPNPNLKSFGLRAAYHIDIESENLDLYLLYVFDFGWIRNKTYAEYNDTPVETRLYDFRGGIRRRFGKYICMQIESGFKLSEIIFGISVKIN